MVGKWAENPRILTVPITAVLVVVIGPIVWLVLAESTSAAIGLTTLTAAAIIILVWWGRTELVPRVKRLIHYASLEDLLDHIEILDTELELRRKKREQALQTEPELNKEQPEQTLQTGLELSKGQREQTLQIGLELRKRQREQTVQTEVDRRKTQRIQTCTDVVTAYSKLLNEARESHSRGDESTGWRKFVAARTEGLKLLEGNQEEIKNQAAVILWKSKQRLSSWQLDDVKGLLQNPQTPNKVKDEIPIGELVRASKILEEQSDNNYENLRRAAWQLYIMIATACAALVFLALAVPRLSESTSLEGNLLLTMVIIIMGALGGATGGFGCVLSLFAGKNGVLYEQVLNSWLVAARPLVGGILSFVAAFFLFSGLMTFGELTLELLLSVCFVAGFSEELVLAVVKRIAGGSSSKE